MRVIDSDTVKIDYNGRLTNIRLIGIDTPETVHPNKLVEVYGKEASNFTKNLLQGEFVYTVLKRIYEQWNAHCGLMGNGRIHYC